ncbi:MAG: VCBS repeat-containing protein [Verrucomicrobia bacterium]|nr:VCBS repeat-containing protein [Verrucomicrobiota bacterium]
MIPHGQLSRVPPRSGSRAHRQNILRCVLLLVGGWLSLGASKPPQFFEHTIATKLRGGYQVVVADLNRDGKPDLIALASGMPELVWFENPGWQRHVLAANLPRMINCVVFESEGHPVMVVGSGFSSEARNSIGNVWVLEPDGDVRQPWKIKEIDRLPTTHRLRLADIDGRGKPVVINGPLTDAHASGPDYRSRTPLLYYRPGEWKRMLITDENEGVMHGICVVDWDGDHRDEILTASFGGIHLNTRRADGNWTRTEISKGNSAAWPKSGASDVVVGHLQGRRFLCSLEPWHGNQVVIYHEQNGDWIRQVIDETFTDGHALATADLAGDGRDAIVAGYRGNRGGLVYYLADDSPGQHWTRHALDIGGITAASCVVVDLNGDGKPDIAAIGSATANLKWYENRN